MGEAEIPEVYLQPGEWRLVRRPAVMKTVLGSCVAITFRAPRLGIAAMCHAMLPEDSMRLHRAQPGRYVDQVICDIAAKLDHLGARRGEVEVKLFGGADVLATDRKEATVGHMNAEAAKRVIGDYGFTVLASHLGGKRGLFLEFHTASGEVLVRRLSLVAKGDSCKVTERRH